MERLDITCIRPRVGTWDGNVKIPFSLASMLEEGFDGILVDAPCSGLGVLRRHPEAKWQKTGQQLVKYQSVQGEILNRVSTYLRPGGVLVYSACSTEPEETLHVISRFCQDHPEFQHENVRPFLPPGSEDLIKSDGNLMTLGSIHNMDGFFAARLRRI
jgi:16S rRNA (cytosine967-C5)-methyltransferase